MHGQIGLGHGVARPSATWSRTAAASRRRPSSQARARGISAHGKFGEKAALLGCRLVCVIVLLIRIRQAGQILHVRELRLGSSGASRISMFGLECALVVDVLVPFAHNIIIRKAYDEVVHDSRVTFPEDLYLIGACKSER